MAHREQKEFLQKMVDKFPKNFSDVEVLEVGSLNINGTVRELFKATRYVGLDVGTGPGVDIVCSGHEYTEKDETFDTVLSCECFEHNPHWKETFSNMHRMTKKNGLVIMTCATEGRREHGTTRTNPQDSPLTIKRGWDYYKNLDANDFLENFEMSQLFSEYEFIVDHRHHDLYFWGLKK